MSGFVSRMVNAPPWAALSVAFAIFLAAFVLPLWMHVMDEPWLFLGVLILLTYFSIRFARCLAGRGGRSRASGMLEAAATVHLLGLVSYLSYPFAHQTARNSIAELLDVDFNVFPAIFAATWGLISIMIVMHYRSTGPADAARGYRVLAIGSALVLVLFAMGAIALVPAVRDLFASFGADLPEPTLWVLRLYEGWMAVPAIGIVLAAIVAVTADRRHGAVRVASGGLIGLLAFANVSLLGTLGALFLPAYKLCGPFHWETGFTRLHAAVHLGRGDSARRHLDRGMPVNAADDRGVTPLHMAAVKGDRDLAALLIERGASINAEDLEGRTPLDGAEALEHDAVARLLRERGGVRSTDESRRLKKKGNPTSGIQAGAVGPCGAV